MPELKEVLENVEKETKALGDNVTALKVSTEKSLKEVRDLAETAGKDGKASSELANSVKALAEGVAEKVNKLEKLAGDLEEKSKALGRLDDIERKLNHLKLTGNGDSPEGKTLAGLRLFHKTKLAAGGNLKPNTDVSDESMPMDEYKSYAAEMHKYLRRGEGSQGAESKAMSVGSDPDGGYFVTPVMSPRILSIIYETSPMRELANVETISTDAIEYAIDDGEAGAGWVGETEARPETGTPQVGIQRIPVHEMYAFPKATQKLLEDAAIDIEAWLADKVGQKFGRLENTAFVVGDGIKKPRGYLTYPNGTTRGTIEQVNSGDANTIGFDSLIKLVTALKEPYLAGSSFVMQRASVGVVMLVKDGNGQYIWRTDAQAGKPSILLGYNVRQASDMQTVAAGNLPVAFGNFKLGYTIVDRLGISVLRDPFTVKPFVGFYTRKRVGGDVTNFEAIKLLKVST